MYFYHLSSRRSPYYQAPFYLGTFSWSQYFIQYYLLLVVSKFLQLSLIHNIIYINVLARLSCPFIIIIIFFVQIWSGNSFLLIISRPSGLFIRVLDFRIEILGFNYENSIIAQGTLSVNGPDFTQ